ncbi:restriction endonuclease subunit S [Planococcus sp. MB-3u-03]|uniref:restriction endonuclease subunit S n=1 Tax=unclassified Planococcus (in: firmicutes) TaxID=2662419 RepID=UPI000C344C4A|nr:MULTISPECIES: restriction endonuclease subunit S [unclassified Planococcus (in: firmicutes)]AUD13077.1 restriction endonuclease subunit S [Planococcus sp. MB-3u-03]PKG45439.1 restriction endonuclease subunit S [Planococcus sp. Urea-trap-24]PKG88965.1 restriction endonuclease subunit S [Planococcus sp. Urea-3u-39]
MRFKLNELMSIKHGFAFKGEFFSESPTNKILVTPGNFKTSGGFNNNKFKYYQTDGPINRDYVFNSGDLIINMTDLSKQSDSLGATALIPDNGKMLYLHNQRVGRVNIERPDLISKEFFYFYSKTRFFRHEIIGSASGTTVKHTSPTKILSHEIELPPLTIQKKISKILLDIENKIFLNMKIINKLEGISDILFRNWFIDFEFPNEEGQPYKSSGGKMVESELGMIPEGWEVKPVSSISKIMSGGTPKTSVEEYWNGDIPFFTPKDVNNSYYSLKTEKYITEAGLDKCASKYYPKNTIFITARGTVGKLALAGRSMAMNQSCYALAHNENYQYYLYLQLKSLMRNIIQSSNGAVFNAITVRDFNYYKIPEVSQEIVEKFENLVSPLFETILNLQEENIQLSNLRDTLLPKLLSGEIEVPVKEPESV